MSKAQIRTADAENNNYTVKVPGYDCDLSAQCVTKDVLVSGTVVNIIDQYNLPPGITLSFGNIRILPNVGDYTYSSNKVWKTADELCGIEAEASLAKAFFFSSEKNPRWQDECTLYEIGTVTSIIDEKYMWVLCRNDVVRKCRTDYMSCDTVPFEIDDQVAVKFENCDKSTPVVVGFWNEPKACGFRFKLTRSDCILVTEENELLDYIKVYAARHASLPLSITAPLYDTETGYWSFNLADAGDADLDGYWVEYKTPCSFRTQYPGKSTSSGIRQEEDLIQFGTYDDTLTGSCFCIRLTRGDGTLITDVLPANASVKKQNGVGAGSSITYNAGTERWEIELTSTYYWPEESYWVSYECTDGIPTQYPYKYKAVDKGNVADLILPGTYEDTIPYWATEGWNEPEPHESTEEDFLGPDGVSVGGTAQRRIYFGDGRSLIKKIRVKSSVPYTVDYSVNAREWVEVIPGHPDVNHWFSFCDAFTVEHFLWWDNEASPPQCVDWGEQVLNTIHGDHSHWHDLWSDEEVMEFTFISSDGGINYVCRKDNLIDINSSENSGPTISGAVYSMTVTNTTPSNHTGYTGPDDECPSEGILFYTHFANCSDYGWPASCDWVNVFGPGANYQ